MFETGSGTRCSAVRWSNLFATRAVRVCSMPSRRPPVILAMCGGLPLVRGGPRWSGLRTQACTPAGFFAWRKPVSRPIPPL